MTPACYVIGAAEWEALITVIALMPLAFFVLAWLMFSDWGLFEYRVRRFFRRRRLRTIRALRLGGAA